MFKISARRLVILGVTASVGCLAVAGQVRAAGLLDFLFGGGEPRRPAVQDFSYDPPPLEMRVRPRRERHAEPARDQKPKLATPIDPKTHPEWYLEDPTLRRGDIVVLKDRVLVFTGGRRGSMDAFASLDQSSLGKGERLKLRQMAGLQYVGRTAAVEADASAVKTRSVRKSRSAKRSRSAYRMPAQSTQTALSFAD